MAPNLHEAEARQKKAVDFALVIREHNGTALETAQLPEAGWVAVQQLLIARGRATRVPSPETRAMVVTLLERMEAEALRCGPDPFAGLS